MAEYRHFAWPYAEIESISYAIRDVVRDGCFKPVMVGFGLPNRIWGFGAQSDGAPSNLAMSFVLKRVT